MRCSMQELLARIANHLERYLEVLRTQGFQPLKDLYLDSWLHSGQKVYTSSCFYKYRQPALNCKRQDQAVWDAQISLCSD